MKNQIILILLIIIAAMIAVNSGIVGGGGGLRIGGVGGGDDGVIQSIPGIGPVGRCETPGEMPEGGCVDRGGNYIVNPKNYRTDPRCKFVIHDGRPGCVRIDLHPPE